MGRVGPDGQGESGVTLANLPLTLNRLEMIRRFLLLISIAAYPGVLQATIGQSLDEMTELFGTPSVEQPGKGIYGWPVDSDKDVFLIAIFDGSEKSVAEQLRAYEGDLTAEPVTRFFSEQVGKPISEGILVHKSDVYLSGVRLFFARLTVVYYDEDTELLCVWEKGAEKPTATVYSKAGIGYRIPLNQGVAVRSYEPSAPRTQSGSRLRI
jgi:hypothetical protein